MRSVRRSAATAARCRPCAPTISAPFRSKALMERNPRRRLGRRRRRHLRLRQSGRRRQPQRRRAWRCCSPGLPPEVPGATINRLCGSSLDAIGIAARAIKSGETSLMIAGGVESMTRAPFVMAKADTAFSRAAKIEDTTIGWRFVNPLMKAKYGIDSMPETAENVAVEFKVRRADQDAFALRSQERAAAAIAAGRLAEEIVPVTIPSKKGDPVVFKQDEHPRATTLEALGQIEGRRAARRQRDRRQRVRRQRRRRARRCSPRPRRRKRFGLTPRARVVAAATAGVAPRIMGFGPAPATRKVLAKAGLKIGDMDVIELNEAFAAQALAVTRDLGLPDDARARQSERRRHRARPSARRQRRAARHDRAVSAAAHRRPLRAVHDVHRRRPGDRAYHRADLTNRIQEKRHDLPTPEPSRARRSPGYRKPDRGTQPDYCYPPYASTVKRSPSQPLVLLPTSLSEVTGPLFGFDVIKANDFDLTKQHAGDPIGERIVVSGRVLDAQRRPVREHAGGDLAGQRRGPLPAQARPAQRADRSQFHRRRPHDDRRGRPLPVRHDPARRISVAQPLQRVASGAHPFLAVRARVRHAARHADVFPRRSAARLRSRCTPASRTSARASA